MHECTYTYIYSYKHTHKHTHTNTHKHTLIAAAAAAESTGAGDAGAGPSVILIRSLLTLIRSLLTLMQEMQGQDPVLLHWLANANKSADMAGHGGLGRLVNVSAGVYGQTV